MRRLCAFILRIRFSPSALVAGSKQNPKDYTCKKKTHATTNSNNKEKPAKISDCLARRRANAYAYRVQGTAGRWPRNAESQLKWKFVGFSGSAVCVCLQGPWEKNKVKKKAQRGMQIETQPQCSGCTQRLGDEPISQPPLFCWYVLSTNCLYGCWSAGKHTPAPTEEDALICVVYVDIFTFLPATRFMKDRCLSQLYVCAWFLRWRSTELSWTPDEKPDASTSVIKRSLSPSMPETKHTSHAPGAGTLPLTCRFSSRPSAVARRCA